jgi:hypothetical protein
VHTNDNFYTNTIDKCSIVFIVLYGGYLLWNKTNNNNLFYAIFIAITCAICGYIYIYGYIKNEYCFNCEKCTANKYHTLMHFISSFGHNCIIFL